MTKPNPIPAQDFARVRAMASVIADAVGLLEGVDPNATKETAAALMRVLALAEGAVAASGSPPSPKSCRWTVQDEDMGGQFATECGKLWMFTTDGIKENGAKFCPYCGGSITEGAASSGSTGAPLNQPTPEKTP